MKIYYLDAEYESGKHKIVKAVLDRTIMKPEDNPRRAINSPHSILVIDESYNGYLARNLLTNNRTQPDGEILPDKYYINNSGQIVNNDTDEVVNIVPNPQKESYKLSQLYGLTQAQLETYIQNQIDSITSLAEAKAVLAPLLQKIAAVTLYLVKQTKLDE